MVSAAIIKDIYVFKTVVENAFKELISSDSIFTYLAVVYFCIVLIRFAWSAFNFIFVYFIRPAKDLKKYGSWAVVTGATDGIGKAYTEELAKRGLNLVIISRTQSKLDDFAAELKQKYDIQVRTSAVDLTKLDANAAGRIASVLQDIDIGILINNAGMAYDFPQYLEEIDATTDINLITINTVAPTLLTKLVLPGMKQRRKGAIVNLGSGNGLFPAVPLLAVYAGTKAFVNQFTKSLSAEVAPFGITVHDQCPLFVVTKMSKIKKPRLDAPTATVWAKSAVKQIGFDPVRSPYWYHGLTLALVDHVLPTKYVIKYIGDLHLRFRTANLKRRAKAEAEAHTGTKKDK